MDAATAEARGSPLLTFAGEPGEPQIICLMALAAPARNAAPGTRPRDRH